MDKKTKNKFDLLVEILSGKFSQIKNIELLNKSVETKRMWSYLVQTIVYLHSIKSLFIGIYVPQTNKFVHDWKEEFNKSKYSRFLDVDEELWKHETNQLIRIGYVTLFHKYETFVGNFFQLLDEN